MLLEYRLPSGVSHTPESVTGINAPDVNATGGGESTASSPSTADGVAGAAPHGIDTHDAHAGGRALGTCLGQVRVEPGKVVYAPLHAAAAATVRVCPLVSGGQPVSQSKYKKYLATPAAGSAGGNKPGHPGPGAVPYRLSSQSPSHRRTGSSHSRGFRSQRFSQEDDSHRRHQRRKKKRKQRRQSKVAGIDLEHLRKVLHGHSAQYVSDYEFSRQLDLTPEREDGRYVTHWQPPCGCTWLCYGLTSLCCFLWPCVAVAVLLLPHCARRGVNVRRRNGLPRLGTRLTAPRTVGEDQEERRPSGIIGALNFGNWFGGGDGDVSDAIRERDEALIQGTERTVMLGCPARAGNDPTEFWCVAHVVAPPIDSPDPTVTVSFLPPVRVENLLPFPVLFRLVTPPVAVRKAMCAAASAGDGHGVVDDEWKAVAVHQESRLRAARQVAAAAQNSATASAASDAARSAAANASEHIAANTKGAESATGVAHEIWGQFYGGDDGGAGYDPDVVFQGSLDPADTQDMLTPALPKDSFAMDVPQATPLAGSAMRGLPTPAGEGIAGAPSQPPVVSRPPDRVGLGLQVMFKVPGSPLSNLRWTCAPVRRSQLVLGDGADCETLVFHAPDGSGRTLHLRVERSFVGAAAQTASLGGGAAPSADASRALLEGCRVAAVHVRVYVAYWCINRSRLPLLYASAPSSRPAVPAGLTIVDVLRRRRLKREAEQDGGGDDGDGGDGADGGGDGARGNGAGLGSHSHRRGVHGRSHRASSGSRRRSESDHSVSSRGSSGSRKRHSSGGSHRSSRHSHRSGSLSRRSGGHSVRSGHSRHNRRSRRHHRGHSQPHTNGAEEKLSADAQELLAALRQSMDVDLFSFPRGSPQGDMIVQVRGLTAAGRISV